jgi:hypothetical protein
VYAVLCSIPAVQALHVLEHLEHITHGWALGGVVAHARLHHAFAEKSQGSKGQEACAEKTYMTTSTIVECTEFPDEQLTSKGPTADKL